MSKIPPLPAKEIIHALEKAGFRIIRQRGSHTRLIHTHDPNRYATIAIHGGDVPRKNVAVKETFGRLISMYHGSITS